MINFTKILFCFVIFLAGKCALAQTQMELLKHWAPEVYQDINTDKQYGRQFYSARDIPVEIDFDGNMSLGDNWNNSHYQVWEQGRLSDRLTPALYAAAYCSFVETVNFYFLGYSYYHAGDDSNIGEDRHENDMEMVMLCIKKDGSQWGSFQGMLTQFHKKHKEYNKNYNRWNGSHPQVYISANGAINIFSPSSHGHGIEDFNATGYQNNQGDDAIVLQVADYGDNVQAVHIPGSDIWNNALRYNYKLISFNELWGWRNNSLVYKSYTTFQGGVGSLKDGGNPPWDKGYFCDPLNKSNSVIPKLVSQFATSSTFNYLHSDIANDNYIYNPYYNNNASQQLIDNLYRIIPNNTFWKKANIGNGDGVSFVHRKNITISAKGQDYSANYDNGYFMYNKLVGDFTIYASVDQVQHVANFTKAGIMVRSSLAADAENVFISRSPHKIVYNQFRDVKGGATSYTQHDLDHINAPVAMKITREGDLISTYYSGDGINYTRVFSQTINFPDETYVGIAVSSNDKDNYASALFKNVGIRGSRSLVVNDENLAPEAEVTVSSEFANDNWSKNKVNDGVKGIISMGEWASNGEVAPWVQLKWDNYIVTDRIVLYDRPSDVEVIHSGTLIFSDGSTISVPELPNNGDALEITFRKKGILWVKFQIDNGTAYNNGIAEFEVFGKYLNNDPNIAPDASITVSSEYVDSNWSKYKLTDGIVGLNGVGEWASNGEVAPWAQLNWDESVTISGIAMYGRPSMYENINSAKLIFSDGSTKQLGAFPKNGDVYEITIPEKTVNWVKLKIESGDAGNNGLSEFKVFGKYTSSLKNAQNKLLSSDDANNDIKIYASNNNHLVTIKNPYKGKSNVNVYDLSGRLVFKKGFVDNTSINTKNIDAKGLLIVKVSCGDNVKVKKIIVR